MTDTFDPLDELASAYLDGEATPEEVARVESDADALARVDALRRVRAELQARRADPVGRAERDHAIAAAVDASDGPRDATVTSLAEVATRRRLTQRGRLVGVAAAVALVAALIPAVSGLGDSSGDSATASRDDDTSTALAIEADAGETADQESAPSTAARSAADVATPLAAAAALTDLGPLPDLPALTDAVRATLAAPAAPGATAVAPSTPEGDVCLSAARDLAVAAGTTLVLTATADVGARPVLATVTAELDGTQVLTVVDPAASCALVAREVL